MKFYGYAATALPAGGAVDALARIIAEPMRSTLGQPIIIENLGGAGGTLAVGRVVRSAPDGYTLGLGTVGQYVISGAVYTLPFDMLADLTPVAPLPSVPYWMTARKTLPANSLKELAQWLKHNNASASTVGTASPLLWHGIPEGEWQRARARRTVEKAIVQENTDLQVDRPGIVAAAGRWASPLTESGTPSTYVNGRCNIPESCRPKMPI
jgi:hypothetical protein